MDDAGYDDDLLADINDEDNGDGPDHDYFRSMADDLSAPSITDLGCGTGILTVTLAKKGRRIVGIDPAAAMLTHAATRPGGDRVEWRRGTSELIDRDANDLIVMSGNVAMHIIDEAWRATLLDIAQGLKAGGRLVFETRNPQPATRKQKRGQLGADLTWCARLRSASCVSPNLLPGQTPMELSR